MDKLLSLFPPHKCELSLTHNPHRSNYETIEEMFTERRWPGPDVWVSDEQRDKAIATDNLWILQWYPETPVGFYVRAACDVEALFTEPWPDA